MMTMLKKTVLALSMFASSVSAYPVDSEMGRKMLEEARQLDQQQNKNYQYYYDGNGNYNDNWVSGMSIKFQGCHHISQWNEAADDESDVRIMTKRLVRFRLCPATTCDSKSSSGCSDGYGDYVLDMNTFLSYYFQAKQTYQAFQCNYLSTYACDCQYSDNEEKCLYYCFQDHGMADVCMGSSNYNDDGSGNSISLEDYMYCTKSGYKDSDGNSLYVGPYCGSQGGGVFLGVFSDDACSVFTDGSATAGHEAFKTSSGIELPYESASIVDMDCVSCAEPTSNNNDGNDADDTDSVAEVCENVYMMAGKCEQHMAYGTVSQPNNNACNYMEGIKIVRKDGTVVTADAKANKTASVFIGLFTVAFVMLSAYVYYLKTKLDRASINLAE